MKLIFSRAGQQVMCLIKHILEKIFFIQHMTCCPTRATTSHVANGRYFPKFKKHN